VLGEPGAAIVDGIPTRFSTDGRTATIEAGGRSTTFVYARADGVTWLSGGFELRTPTREQLLAEHRASLGRVEGAASPEIRSVMPGTVVSVTAATGDVVEAGQPLLTIEAMKMEHAMLASVAGTVTITVAAGDQVRLDQLVATIHPHEGAAS
jgi:acetyl-CoA/propionyl-CoA carboxylase biotin carboxyl carrier protein